MLLFSIVERSILVGLVFYYKDVRKGNDANSKEPRNSQFLFVTEGAQINAVHAQLLKKLRH